MPGTERLMGHQAVKAYMLMEYSLAESSRQMCKQDWKQFVDSGGWRRHSGNWQGLALQRVDLMNFSL